MTASRARLEFREADSLGRESKAKAVPQAVRVLPRAVKPTSGFASCQTEAVSHCQTEMVSGAVLSN